MPGKEPSQKKVRSKGGLDTVKKKRSRAAEIHINKASRLGTVQWLGLEIYFRVMEMDSFNGMSTQFENNVKTTNDISEGGRGGGGELPKI